MLNQQTILLSVNITFLFKLTCSLSSSLVYNYIPNFKDFKYLTIRESSVNLRYLKINKEISIDIFPFDSVKGNSYDDIKIRSNLIFL